MMRTVVKWALRPRVCLPILLGVVLLLALLTLGNAHDVVSMLGRFQPRYLLAFAAAMLAYEAVRCLQWRFLLTALGIHVPVRTQVFTYVTGEVMKSLPVGNFFPDYVLQRSQGTDFGLASSITLAINLMEVALTLVGLVVLGVSAWGWLRPLILFGLAGFALFVWLVWLFARRLASVKMGASVRLTPIAVHRLPALSERLLVHPSVRRAVEELRQFRAGSVQILRPRVLLPAALCSATYLVFGGLGLALLAWGLGLQQVTLGQALVVYFFSLAFATIIPLPMDLGSTELGGVGVFLALGVGVGKSAAIGVMVLDRTLALGFTFAIALVVGLVLQAEVRAELRSFLRTPIQPPVPATLVPATPRKSSRRMPLLQVVGARAQIASVVTGSGVPGIVRSGLEPENPVMAFATCTRHTLDERGLPAGQTEAECSPCSKWIRGDSPMDAADAA